MSSLDNIFNRVRLLPNQQLYGKQRMSEPLFVRFYLPYCDSFRIAKESRLGSRWILVNVNDRQRRSRRKCREDTYAKIVGNVFDKLRHSGIDIIRRNSKCMITACERQCFYFELFESCQPTGRPHSGLDSKNHGRIWLEMYLFLKFSGKVIEKSLPKNLSNFARS